MMKRFIEVKLAQNSKDEWYILPKHVYNRFMEDVNDMEEIQPEEFYDKYARYCIGEDLDEVILYAELTEQQETINPTINMN